MKRKHAMRRWFRKLAHKRYIDKYLNELRWDSLNALITASRTEWNESVIRLLDNNLRTSSANMKGGEDG